MDNSIRLYKDKDPKTMPDDVLLASYDDKLDGLAKARMASDAAIRDSIKFAKEAAILKKEVDKRKLKT